MPVDHLLPRTRAARTAAALTSAAVLAGSAFAGGSASGASTPRTLSAVAALPAAAQATLLSPLRELATVISGGAGRYRSTFTSVVIDAPADRVTVWSTTHASGEALLAGARRRDPHAPWSKVRVEVSHFAQRTLDAAAATLTRTTGARALSRILPATDGSGLTADLAADEGTAIRPAALPARVDGVPVAYRTATPTVSKAWADVKWHDVTPFIGGDVLTSNGQRFCTAGLPAVRVSDGRPVMITAAHCFSVGQRVYTGAGGTGAYGNGQTGNYVGTVTARNQTWDAETLMGGNNNADESDTTRWIPLHGVAYSYDGDFVCQDGAASFYLGHPTPCGIEVTDDDLWFSINGYWARGVEGVDYAHGWGSHGGDSGGTVFAVLSGGVHQVRGIVSSGGADGTYDQRRVDWTEAVDIFHAYGLKLNPTT